MAETIITLRVKEIVLERSDVKTFRFVRTDGEELHYRAGQFLTFLIPSHGHEVRRSYSFSSAPGIDEFPAITVKRVANGEVSRMWTDHVQVGDVFNVLAPSGRFVVGESLVPRDLVMIGGGSGITPLLSMIKWALVHSEDQITLFYANRNTSSTLFAEELAVWQNRFPGRFKIIHLHSQPDDDWAGLRGRLNNARLEQMLANALRLDRTFARFFICGPSEFMRNIEITLHYLGFSRDQIRKENFVIEKIPPPPPESYPHRVRILFKDQQHDIVVPARTTILDAALAEGIRLPYSCKGGRCSTCAAVCTAGKLHMSVNEVLTDRDLAEGWILSCSAYPDDDEVVLEIK